mgnify:CR=1 FL=1
MSNLNYTRFKNVMKEYYNLNVDDLPVYKLGILKYYYKLQSLSTKDIKNFYSYIEELVKNVNS